MTTVKGELVILRELMDAFKVYIPLIEQHGLNSQFIQQLIEEHVPIKAQLKMLRARYEVSKDGVPILTRPISYADPTTDAARLDTLVNNKLNNSFDSEIIDTKNGYFLGNPINYVVNKEKVSNFDALSDELDKMRVRDNVQDKDATFGKSASIGGYGARLCYIGLENDKPVVRFINKNPENCIFFYNETMSEPRYAMEYYDTVIVQPDGQKLNATIVDFYDELYLYRFTKTDGDFVAEAPFLHGFSSTPLFGLENNDELTGEAQKILALIDAFDRTISDASNEIEATRLAILLLYNLGMDKEEIEKMKGAGVLEAWGDKVDAKFLTKDVNDQMIEHHLTRLDKNIMRFAKSVDFTNEKFTADLSGIAILFKTMSLEHKTVSAENKMRSALQYQMKVMCSAWAKLGICQPDDYLNIWFAFKRNLPQNIKEAAEATVALKGNVSERTRLSLLPFIDDVEAELEAMKQDKIEFGEELAPLEPFAARGNKTTNDE